MYIVNAREEAHHPGCQHTEPGLLRKWLVEKRVWPESELSTLRETIEKVCRADGFKAILKRSEKAVGGPRNGRYKRFTFVCQKSGRRTSDRSQKTSCDWRLQVAYTQNLSNNFQRPGWMIGSITNEHNHELDVVAAAQLPRQPISANKAAKKAATALMKVPSKSRQ